MKQSQISTEAGAALPPSEAAARPGSYTITTLGCKVNQYESQAIETLLAERGLRRAGDGERPDAALINTCAVTGEAGRKSRQAIRRLRRANPDAVVAVCGCFSQLEAAEAAALGADIIFGSSRRGDFALAVAEALAGKGAAARAASEAPPIDRRFEELPAGPVSGRTRAMLKIEDGCDNFCSYCVIPFARGRVRSLPPERAASQAAELEREGFRELVITGIEIASYGKDMGGAELADVVAAIAAAAPGCRLRLGSLEPTVVTEAFCERLRSLGTVCPHFHLSLQSGCDETLRAMNRRYATGRFYESVRLLREAFPGCGLTADLITGFPGETEEHFAKTLAFIEKCAFSAMHVFPYSERPGTRAAAMDGRLPKALREERALRARELARTLERDYLAARVGETLSVLFETEENGLAVGHAGNYALVSARGEGLRGLVKNVAVIGVSGQTLAGELA